MQLQATILIVPIVISTIGSTLAAPTKEVELSSALEVKQQPSKEDLDQYYKDQPHLRPENDAETGRPSTSGSSGQQSSQVTSSQDWVSLLSQLGGPINTSSLGAIFITGPMDLLSQYMNMTRRQQTESFKTILADGKADNKAI